MVTQDKGKWVEEDAIAELWLVQPEVKYIFQ